MPVATCPSQADLSEFLLGRLPPESASDLEQHVDSCPRCQENIRQLNPSDDWIPETLKNAGEASVTLETNCRAAIDRIAKLEPSVSLDKPLQSEGSDERTEDLGTIGFYKLLAKLGEGGMGAVYKAQHTRLRRTVAVKVLPADRVQSSEAIARFDREMQAVGALDHQNIVRAFDAGDHDGRHYIAMEYVRGRDVSQVARAVGPLPIAEACEIIRQAAVGLQHAHEAGLVHRDIKPGNLMLTDAGVVKILDLGLARLGHTATGSSELTSTGQVMGTLDYMAPEQGGDTHSVDIRADIYSLGASLYRLLTGEAPFGEAKYDSPVKKLMALATAEPAPVQSKRPDVPPELAAVIHKMLAKTPDQRPSTPADVEAALAPFCRGADLKALATDSLSLSPVLRGEGRGEGPKLDTSPHLSSPLTGTVTNVFGKPGVDQSALTVSGPTKPSSTPPLWRRPWAIAAAAGGLALVLLGIVLLIPTPRGVIRVEINDPKVRTYFENGTLTIKKADKDPIQIAVDERKDLPVGDYWLDVTWGGKPFKTRSFKLERKGETVVKVELLPGEIRLTQNGAEVAREPLPEQPPTSAQIGGLEFDGVDDYVTLPKIEWDRKSPLTFEAWVTPRIGQEQLPGPQAIWGHQGCFLLAQNYGWQFYHHKVSAIGGQVKAGRRVHLVAQWDGTRCVLYVDGVGVNSNPGVIDAAKGVGVTLMPRVLGALGNTQGEPLREYFAGRIDEVRISRCVRYPDDAFTPPQQFEADADTLVLYHCDEGSGDKLTDSSGNNHHGTIVGAQWPKATTRVPALAFDGVDDYVDIPRLSTRVEGPISVEAWLTVPAWEHRAIINVSGKRPFSLYTDQGVVGFWCLGKKIELSAPESLLRQRVHVAGVYDEEGLAVFLNGQPSGKVPPLVKTADESLSAYIGTTRDWEKDFLSLRSFFRGQLHALRISQSARYSQAFVPDTDLKLEEDTLALYRFDKGSGDILHDASKNAFHGKIVGAKWVEADGDRIDSPRFALDLNQHLSSGEARVELPFTLRPSEPCTVEMYVTPRSADSMEYCNLFVVGDGVQLRQQKDSWDWLAPRKDGAYDQIRAPAAVIPGQRTHLAGVSTGKELRLFVAGKLAGKCPVSDELNDAPRSALIGGHAAHFEQWSPFDGLIEEVRISKAARYEADFTPQPRLQTDDNTLVLYHCDEGPGEQLLDSSGNKHHGKIVGAKWVKVDAAKPLASSAPDHAVDLLKLVDIDRDAVKGKWTLTADGLASDGTVAFCRLKLPYAPPAEYDFRVEFTATGGNDILQLLTAGGRDFTWLMGAWGGKFDGFDAVRDHPLPREGTNIIGGPTSIRRGQRHTSLIQVRKDSITAVIDGKQVVRHATDGSDLSMPREWTIGEGAIGLGTTFDAVVFHKVELVVPTKDPADSAGKGAVDLLALIDTKRDTLSGRWKMEDGKLVGGGANATEPAEERLKVDYELPQEYNVVLVAARSHVMDQGHALTLLLPRPHAFQLVLDGRVDVRSLHGLQTIDGEIYHRNETTVDGTEFLEGRPVRVECLVRRRSIRVRIDGKDRIVWRGDFKRLGIHEPFWSLPHKNCVGIGSQRGEYVIHEWKVMPLARQPALAMHFQGAMQPVFRRVESADDFPAQLFVRARTSDDEFGDLPLDSPVIEQVFTGRIGWSSDRSRMIQADDKEAILWNATNGKVLHRLKREKAVALACLSPDGKLAATAEDDGTVVTWNAETGEDVVSPAISAGKKQFLSWLPDGSSLAVGGPGGLELLDPQSGKRLDFFDCKVAVLEGGPWRSHVWLSEPRASATGVSEPKTPGANASGSPRWLALRCIDGVHVFDCEQQAVLHAIKADPRGRFSHDGEHYLWSDASGAIKQAEVRNGKVTDLAIGIALSKTPGAHASGSLREDSSDWLAVSPEGHYRASRDVSQEIVYVVETDKGQETLSPAEFEQRFGWKNDPTKVVAFDLDLPKSEPGSKPEVAKIEIEPEPFEFEKGSPISPEALVARPAELPGLASWTVDTLPGGENFVQIQFSPDGKWFATASNSDPALSARAGITIWDAKRRVPLRRLPMPDGTGWVRWSPDSNYLMTKGRTSKYSCSIWDSGSGRLVRTIDGALHDLFVCDWSPDGKLIACQHGNLILLKDPRTKEIQSIIESSGELGGIAWSRDKRMIGFAQRDRLYAWDTVSQRITKVVGLTNWCGAGFSWLGDSYQLASAPPGTGGLTISSVNSLKGGSPISDTSTARLAASPDGDFVFAEGKVFDAVNQKFLRAVFGTGHTTGIPAWSADSRLIAQSTPIGDLTFWRPHASEPLEVVRGVSRQGSAGDRVRLGKNGRVALPGQGTEILLASSLLLKDGSGFVRFNGSALEIRRNGTEKGISVAMWGTGAASYDGKYLLVGVYSGGDYAVITLEDGKVVHRATHTNDCFGTAWSRDGRYLAVSGAGKTIVVETRDYKPVAELPAGWGSVAFSARGDRLSISGLDGITIWDWKEARRQHQLDIVTDRPPQVVWAAQAWRNEDRELVAVSGNRVITIDTTAGKIVREFAVVGHAVQFNQDDSLLIAADGNHGLRTYDVATGKLLETILYLRDDNWLVISPEGHYRCSEGAKKWLCYVALTEDGAQLTLSPEEFEQKYGWKNDPEKVKLAE